MSEGSTPFDSSPPSRRAVISFIMRPIQLALVLNLTATVGCAVGADAAAPIPPAEAEAGPDGGVVDAPNDAPQLTEAGTRADAPPFENLWGDCKPRHWETAAGSPQLDPGSGDGKLTLLPDGRVMIGVGEGIYDPVHHVYQEFVPFGGEWDGATITVLADGKSALVAGGGYLAEDTPMACVLDLNHLDHRCRFGARLLSQRSGAWAQLRPDGKVFVLGGAIISSEGHPIPDAEEYDPIADRWTAVAAPDEVLHVGPGPDGTRLEDGRWLVLAGYHAYLFDPQLDTWARASEPPAGDARGDSLDMTISLADGRVMVAGGFTPLDNLTWSTSIYDPKFDTWTPPAVIAMVRPGGDGRDAIGPVMLHDLGCGRVFLLAVGNRKDYWGARAFLYSFDSNEWSELPDAPKRLGNAHGAVLPDGRLVAGFGSLVSMTAKYNQLLVLTDAPAADVPPTPSHAP